MTAVILSPPPAPGNAALLEHALAYAGRGLSIIPVTGKKPAGFWKPFQEQAADQATLRRLFAKPGITGLAVVLGSVSGGLACRDFDDDDAYRRWADAHPDLAATLPTVQTCRGYHLYFVSLDGENRKFCDGEYRADRQICVLPPSRHPDGVLYRWSIPLPDGKLPVVDPQQARMFTQERAEQTQAETQAETQAHPIHTLHVLTNTVETAILATLPTGPRQRNHCIWELARRLKGAMPGATMDALEPIVREWYTRALPVIRTKDWLESWVDFREAWARAKRPMGATMARIAATAKTRTSADADAIVRLTVLCRAMQEHHGPDRAWPLSCRVAGELIGVSHVMAARVLKMLVLEGTLERVTPAGPKSSRRAAEYRVAGR